MRSPRIAGLAALAVAIGIAGSGYADMQGSSVSKPRAASARELPPHFGLGGAAEGAPVTKPPAASARAPPTRFGLGVQADMSQVNGWMVRSNAAWDYAYRYIG